MNVWKRIIDRQVVHGLFRPLQSNLVCTSKLGKPREGVVLATKCIHCSASVGAGHNKWSKIHRKKAVADLERSKVIQKFISRITTAIRTGGGPDSDVNIRLASLIQQAKSEGVTKVNIETAIRQASSKQAGGELYVYEARADLGFMLVIEVLTDKNSRTRPIIKNFLLKHGCQFGSALFNFDHKGIVRVPCQELQNSKTDPMDLAIEVGAEDVVSDLDFEEEASADSESSQHQENSDSDSCFQFRCDPKDLKSVSDAIKEQSYSISSASLEYVPKTMVELERRQYEKAVQLVDMLLEKDDVIEVYDNFTLKKGDSTGDVAS